MLKIWGRSNSLNVQKVLWFATELGVAYETIPAGGKYGGLDTPEFLSMNPHGHVPVLDDQGTVVWESHSILRYLAAKYGKSKFWPEDAGERSLADRWMDWAQTSLQPDFMGVFWGFYRTPEPQRDWPMIRQKMAGCAQHFKLLDRWLEGHAYILGDDLSLADIPAGSMLYRYFEMGIEYPSMPNVMSWYQNLERLPAYRENIMTSFEDLRGRITY
ncbi:glutathione S-transferase family protein [Pleomorphomonas sp. PLEO]|uniref:glutathione S-transferase family protein n=1 Tax=Pleomorphomonas sp. PLEO TaxID=3239306 RepID=UPI00351E8F17